ncbi:SRPBCC domain-containing protein [Maribellus sediminis]|uniref:SRPBCC domain-containing protein n=1 Tax=Maribellus sediminis TaxID=2696285 RepID=UPI0014300B34|nr:SRPBCC domain-containing protein [Maribellus sediminis]
MKDIKRYYTIKADPADVYNALTNQKMLEIWTGEDVVMQAEAGTEFSLWNGSISGKNLELEPNTKIVQQWYFGEEEASVVTIKLHPHKKGTSVELHHTNIPDEAFENISDGWDEDYFGALNELFI